MTNRVKNILFLLIVFAVIALSAACFYLTHI